MLSNICDLDCRSPDPVSDDSLEPNGVIGDELFGDSSDEPRVDWLEPLPRLFSTVELWERCVHAVLGMGGGDVCGTYALG